LARPRKARRPLLPRHERSHDARQSRHRRNWRDHYYRHGKSPDAEFKLALKAIQAACDDAGIDPREIDGFSSYANDRNEASRLAAALGTRSCELAHAMGRRRRRLLRCGGQWCRGDRDGMAECVVVFRALAQGAQGRFGTGASTAGAPENAYMQPYGVLSPTQKFTLKIRRYMELHGVRQEALRAIALAAYHMHRRTRAR
jgi:sugar phosphate isomerase/epimerase